MTPTETTLSGKTYLMVEVPEDILAMWIEGRNMFYRLSGGDFGRVVLPIGDYDIIGLCPDIEESVWEGIVERTSTHFKDYEGSGRYTQFTTATESARSWIASQGREWERTVILVEK